LKFAKKRLKKKKGEKTLKIVKKKERKKEREKQANYVPSVFSSISPPPPDLLGRLRDREREGTEKERVSTPELKSSF